MSEKVNGNLIIIGGAEDKKGDKEILKRVAKLYKSRKRKIINSNYSNRISRKKLSKL